MYYKRYLESLRAWGIFKTMPGEEDRCIVSFVEEMDCYRILAELGAIIELPIKGASRYSLTLFKDGWTVFLISQELPVGRPMIRGKWNFFEIPEYGK